MTSCGCGLLAFVVVGLIGLAAFLTGDRSEPEYLILTPLLVSLLVFGVLSLLDKATG